MLVLKLLEEQQRLKEQQSEIERQKSELEREKRELETEKQHQRISEMEKKQRCARLLIFLFWNTSFVGGGSLTEFLLPCCMGR